MYSNIGTEYIYDSATMGKLSGDIYSINVFKAAIGKPFKDKLKLYGLSYGKVQSGIPHTFWRGERLAEGLNGGEDDGILDFFFAIISVFVKVQRNAYPLRTSFIDSFSKVGL